MLRTQILVIGSEGAGARAAIAAADAGAEVTIVTKGRLARTGATITGAADLDVDSASLHRLLGRGDPADSPEAFFHDMVIEGRYLNDQPLAEAHVQEAPLRVAELLEWGLKVYDLRQMPGHSYPRNMYTSGHDLMMVLKRQVRKRSIKLLEDTLVTDLLLDGGEAVGAMALDLRRGEPLPIAASAVVLAAGGGHNVYRFNTGPEDLTGDGYGLALRAGVELVNMEMTQSIPTTLIEPPIAQGNLFPFLLGPQNALRYWLLNKYGERFMAKWDPLRMEHSTRDLLTVGIGNEVAAGRGGPKGGVYFSLAHLPKNLVEDFARWGAKPFIEKDWSAHGLNFRQLVEKMLDGEAIEVGPAVHFFMGGVRTDEHMATSVNRLFAAGEVAGGVHGANRLSGNAFAQIVTQGCRAGEQAAALVRDLGEPAEPSKRFLSPALKRLERPLRASGGPSAYELRAELQELAHEQVGVIRDGPTLAAAAERVADLRRSAVAKVSSRAREREYNREWAECLALENMALTLEAIARSALFRTESRGAHYRRDFPSPDDANWLRNTVARLEGGALAVDSSPVRITTLQPNDA